MTIGPAPMIMIDLMSVRFGISLHRPLWVAANNDVADKKRAR
jgi:hypothetical protein